MTEGDMLGLPTIEGGTTKWNPPDFISQACVKPCMLALEELNRASREVQNVALQLTLDRELSNGAKLHPKTRVVAAINTGAMYQVTRMDPALIDRFFVIELAFCAKEWLKYAKEEIGLPKTFIAFLQTQPDWLNPSAGDKSDPNDKGTSPRSAERCGRELARLLEEGDKNMESADRTLAKMKGSTEPMPEAYDKDLIRNIAGGCMGRAFADAFDVYLRSVEAGNGTAITSREVFENWTALRENVDLNRIDIINAAVDLFISHCEGIESKEGYVLPPNAGESFKALLGDVPKEVRTLVYQRMLALGMKKVHLIKALNEFGKERLLEVYGTKPGDKGVGMLPTNPGAIVRKNNAA